MMNIYQDKPDDWRYYPPTIEMRNYGGPRKRMGYEGGVLYVWDHGQGVKIAIPVSRWKLIMIGFNFILATLEGKGAPRE
jgi:hypothetical protein